MTISDTIDVLTTPHVPPGWSQFDIRAVDIRAVAAATELLEFVSQELDRHTTAANQSAR